MGSLALLLVLLVVISTGASTQSVAPTAAAAGVAAAPAPDHERLLAQPARLSSEGFEAAVATAGGEVVGRIARLGIHVIEVPTPRVPGALRDLSRSSAVAFVERDAPVTLLTRLPNDPLYEYQWSAELVRAPEAWSISVGDEDVLIAVLDTGVDESHEDLQGAVVGEANFIDPAASADDDHGHGTLAAGAAAARTDNGRGVAGSCWTCSILDVKVLDQQGRGSLSSVASGVVYATDQGADIINMSLGSSDSSSTLQSAVTYAERRGVLLVAAAGNEETTDLVYPAAYDEVIGVAAVDRSDQRYVWSSHGSWVDVAAPGCTLSTDFDPSRRYSWFCGTSAASPIVAGIGGLAFALGARPTSEQIRAALSTTATPVGDIVRFGRVDAGATLQTFVAASTSPSPSPGPSPSPTPSPSPRPSPPIAPLPPIGDGDDETVPPPAPGTSIERLAGSDRYETAVTISRTTFDPGLGEVFLVSGEHFPDALSAGAAAGAVGSPVLLTRPDVLPQPVADELRRLAPGRVTIVGGPEAVGLEVAERAGAVAGAPVRRVAGATRYETAAAVAGAYFGAPRGTVFVATGEAFPDALAGVPAAGQHDAPLLLVTKDDVPVAVETMLGRLAPERIILLGGEEAISPQVARQLSETTPDLQRIAGADRYATAAAIAERTFPGESAAVILATGTIFPDALAGGAAAASLPAPVVLVTRDAVPASSQEELTRTGANTLKVLGGVLAISEDTAQQAAQFASEGDPS